MKKYLENKQTNEQKTKPNNLTSESIPTEIAAEQLAILKHIQDSVLQLLSMHLLQIIYSLIYPSLPENYAIPFPLPIIPAWL